MKIQSTPMFIQCGIEEVEKFLTVPANIEFLLPRERISEFKADELGCEFKVQGGIVIPLLFESKTQEGILYKSGSKAPFPFSLQIVIYPIKSGVEGYLNFNGEAPTMVAMLAKNPLTALFNDMGNNLKKQLESPN